MRRAPVLSGYGGCAAPRDVALPAAELAQPVERLAFELPASLLAHPERRADLGVRLRVARDAEAAHQDLAVPRRHDLEHRPHLATGLPIVEPTPRVLGIGV